MSLEMVLKDLESMVAGNLDVFHDPDLNKEYTVETLEKKVKEEQLEIKIHPIGQKEFLAKCFDY